MSAHPTWSGRSQDVLKLPNAALRFHPPGGVAADRRSEQMVATAGAAVVGAPAVVWVPGDRGEPSPVPIGIGAGDPTATEIVTGPLREGQPVIVGTAAANGGASIFGFRLGR